MAEREAIAGPDARNGDDTLARARRRMRGGRPARFDTQLVERMEDTEPEAVARHDLSSAAMRAGNKLRALRLALGWSQTRLARAAGLDPSVLCAYEAGRGKDGPTFANLERIAAAAGMQIAFVPAGEEPGIAGQVAAGRAVADLDLADRMVAQVVQAVDRSVEHRLDRLVRVLEQWQHRLHRAGQEPHAGQDAHGEVTTPGKVEG